MITTRIGDILLVEDNPCDVALIRLALQESGSECGLYDVPDGRAAAEFLRERMGSHAPFALPSLIITDIRMPGHSGHDFLAWKQTQLELAKIPVVVLSGSASDADLQRSYALGARSCLLKPSTFPEFTHLVRTLLTFWVGFNHEGF